MSIEFFNESGFDGVNEEMLIDVASFALGAMDVNPDVELTMTCVDLETIEELHVRWMDLEGPTDVMSFPIDEITPGAMTPRPDAPDMGPAMLGDIVLCPAFAERQADAAGHSLSHELALLTTHGCLHLLGYDHGTPSEEQEMFALQNELLADWYDSLAKRGLTFHPKPSGAKAFPSAADRETLDDEIDTDFE
ncbi:rRNA maturation RNase YbeY [Corynebacterium ammoniagenes]|uniref:Endoribonuclease YbeY n=2 Tax=Corynebacterium ammoniagenes TaxID=1697 RepID=A0AAV5G5I5_CORAM|nr:rRNA maturation RNase YbeY [Corynebacterium ammoniagenes]APT82151.1 heat-shock protein [Corynebacterium ammoniagenes DSM 20306]AQS73248.1 rRNA maturation RNase YbeY [Corynebacterium ammoniagenes]EFG80292.1 translation metalloprotein YbeY [Corynebacterium ammoniagenes DSM 20306]NMF31936.1 rRNA maturation RNase YbeY [Corynebacterium ammoniagenes]GJN41973.1 endoribonuclease YbeY [Corynebacterium ammoniagenes]